MISEGSLREGEAFEKDINNIIDIIDGVEKNMCHDKLSHQFKRNQNVSYNRRKLEMTRTILAQTNHQHNFMLKQAMLQSQMLSEHGRSKNDKQMSQSLMNFNSTSGKPLQGSNSKYIELT